MADRRLPQFEVVSTTRDRLGEAPHWDDERDELVHVDILAGLVHGWRPTTGNSWRAKAGGEVSAAIPCQRGGFVLAVGHELIGREPQGDTRVLASTETEIQHTRFNDCRCDARGRLWAGTMSRERVAGSAGLYRLEPSGELELVVTGTTISNGIGWSADASLMYFIDSPTQRIDVFDYDLSTGDLANRRQFAAIERRDGLPDGLTVDAEDCVWVCLFGGGAVRRYAPDGGLEEHIPLPVTNPTCPAFGDEDLSTLYLTSARHRLSPSQLATQPAAGAVLALRPGATGQPGRPFTG